MANTDYTARNLTAPFCPKAYLNGAIAALDATMLIENFRSADGSTINVGSAVMIGSEIMKVLSVTGSTIGIGRGCCDTAPQAHADNAPVWFLDGYIAVDPVRHPGTGTRAVKCLSQAASATLTVAQAPPIDVALANRFIRPYPPAQVQANAGPFTTVVVLSGASPTLTISWVQRNRITQGTSLVDHSSASVPHEAGTQYRLRLYKSDNTLVETVLVPVSPHVFNVFRIAELFAQYGSQTGYVLLDSQRDGYDSRQAYRIDFSYSGIAAPASVDLALIFDVIGAVTQDLGVAYSVG